MNEGIIRVLLRDGSLRLRQADFCYTKTPKGLNSSYSII